MNLAKFTNHADELVANAARDIVSIESQFESGTITAVERAELIGDVLEYTTIGQTMVDIDRRIAVMTAFNDIRAIISAVAPLI